MKTPRPGQFTAINGVYFRAHKRTNGCHGCALKSIVLCPNVVDSRNGTPPLDCAGNNIILKRMQ